MSGSERCACGHVLDEHDFGDLSCTVDDCLCFYFELEEGDA